MLLYLFDILEYFFLYKQGQQPVEFNHAINYVNKIKVKDLCHVVLLVFILDTCSF